jgi:ankyrin repeat protein
MKKTYTTAELEDYVISGNIPKDVTAEQLANAKDFTGLTALHWAAAKGHLDQISGGVTAEQLANAIDDDGWTALHFAAGGAQLDKISGGVTAEQLTNAKDNHGWTALHSAACTGQLDQISGGVTADQLANTESACGTIALELSIKNLNKRTLNGTLAKLTCTTPDLLKRIADVAYTIDRVATTLWAARQMNSF